MCKEDRMKRRYFEILALVVFLGLTPSYAAAHCEIPCGIYDDKARIEMISEHITTIERSMKQILALKGTEPVNYNQLVRWVMNKESHANQMQEIITQYFMTQRIIFDTKAYSKKLQLLHQLLVYGMKCKQTTDLSYISKLRTALHDFDHLYFGGGER
jgi:nickel superoxide dismutase